MLWNLAQPTNTRTTGRRTTRKQKTSPKSTRWSRYKGGASLTSSETLEAFPMAAWLAGLALLRRQAMKTRGHYGRTGMEWHVCRIKLSNTMVTAVTAIHRAPWLEALHCPIIYPYVNSKAEWASQPPSIGSPVKVIDFPVPLYISVLNIPWHLSKPWKRLKNAWKYDHPSIIAKRVWKDVDLDDPASSRTPNPTSPKNMSQCQNGIAICCASVIRGGFYCQGFKIGGGQLELLPYILPETKSLRVDRHWWRPYMYQNNTVFTLGSYLLYPAACKLQYRSFHRRNLEWSIDEEGRN